MTNIASDVSVRAVVGISIYREYAHADSLTLETIYKVGSAFNRRVNGVATSNRWMKSPNILFDVSAASTAHC